MNCRWHPFRSCFSASRWSLIGPGLALLLLSPAAFADKIAKVPDWVSAAVAQPIPQFTGDPAAVVLLSDTEYAVNSQGKTEEHVRMVWKILRPKAREDISHVAAYYRKSLGKVNDFHAWSVAPNGTGYVMEKKDVQDVDVHASFELYSDSRLMYAQLPADVGYVVAEEYTLESQAYVSDYVWYPQESYPALKERLTLVMPQGFTYKAIWKGHDTAEARDLEHGRTMWEMDNVPAVDIADVPLSPSAGALYRRLDVHYTGPGVQMPTNGTWKGLGEWYEVLAKGRNDADDAITRKAQELTSGKKDFAEKAQALGEFVQQKIRYVAIEIGVGGEQPHSAAEIMSHSYGDCKDKATLLSAMMRAAGLRSTWVMVDTNRGSIVPEAPSIHGNHMIAAIEIPEGYDSAKFKSVVKTDKGKRYLIFDPTWERTPFGQLESELQGGYGLLIDGADSQAIHLPVLKPDTNLVRRQASFQLSAEGALKGSVKEIRSGDIARNLRRLYAEDSRKEQEEFRRRTLGQDLGAFHVSDLKTENVDSLLNDLTITYSLEADHFARPMGSLVMVRPRVLGTTGYALDRKERKIPIDLRQPKRVEDEFDIEIPKGYAVDELPRAVSLDMGFAAYQSMSEVKDGKLHYKRSYEVREVTLPAEKYKDLQHMASVIEDDEQSTAIFKKVN